MPVVRFDGKSGVSGASDCQLSADEYRDLINDRLAETGEVSPVGVTGSFLPLEYGIPITATFSLLDPATLVDLRATLLLYEDNILYNGENWQHVVRDIVDENIVLANVDDEVTVSTNISVDPSWNVTELHAVAYLQQVSGNKVIIQGVKLPVSDFTLEFANHLASLPDANGTTTFPAQLKNLSDSVDTFTLELTSTFGNWPTDFFVCGDPNPHTDPLQIELQPGETCEIDVRVQTDGTVDLRSGGFRATSQSSTRSVEDSMRLFNGDHSILLVDDDYTETNEGPIVAALEAQGQLYELWDIYNVHGMDGPSFADMKDFDYVIWHTGLQMGTYILTNFDVEAMMQYVDNGGSLLLSSQHYLNSLGETNSFVSDYLGVDSWVLDTGYTQLDGVTDDPIGDGLSLELNYSIPFFRQGDDALPGSADPVLLAPDGSHGMLRNKLDGAGKVVFMPVALHVVDDSPEDPDNLRTLIERVLDWLEPETPTDDVVEFAGLRAGSRIEHVRPNPLNPQTEIVFTLSPAGAAGSVRLELFDPSGRKIMQLFEGRLPVGTHSRSWAGRSDSGESLRSGVYFARLITLEGTSAKKLILMK